MSTGESIESGFPYQGVEWFLDHHQAKAAERRQMLADLNIREGLSVLDLACGPGLWAPWFAELVGPTGQVVGLDLTETYLRYAVSSQADEPLGGPTSFAVGSIFSLPFSADSFDIVFLGNALSAHANAQDVIAEMTRVTRPGGRVIVKEWDDSTFLFHPVSARLVATVLYAVTVALEAEDARGSNGTSWPRNDGFMGRKVRGLLVRGSLEQVTSRAYAIHKTHPLENSAKRYIQGNANFLGETAAPFLTDEQLRAWEAAFDPESDDYVLDDPDLFFCLTEVVAVGTVVAST